MGAEKGGKRRRGEGKGVEGREEERRGRDETAEVFIYVTKKIIISKILSFISGT